jgi:1-acyl-sn-glycerol-3-phosphate acyltransferase
MPILKQIILLILVIIFSNILVLIYSIRKGAYGLTLYINNLINIKIKTINTNNLHNFTKNRIIIMTNHMNGIDYLPIAQVFNNLNKNKKLYTVVTSTLFSAEQNKNMITNTMDLFGDSFFNYCNFIKYIKRDKDSGKQVRQKIIEIINNNNTVLLFPEGIVTRKGIPESFKPGSFEICKENSISILPITIKYNKDLGVNENENGKFLDWINTEVTLYIHDIIIPNKCVNANEMMQKTLDAIRKPLI